LQQFIVNIAPAENIYKHDNPDAPSNSVSTSVTWC